MNIVLILTGCFVLALFYTFIYQFRTYHPIYRADMGRQMSLGQYYGMTAFLGAFILKFYFDSWLWSGSIVPLYFLLRFGIGRFWEILLRYIRPMGQSEVQEWSRLGQKKSFLSKIIF